VSQYFDVFSVNAVETDADIARRKSLLAKSVTNDFLDWSTFRTLQQDFAFIDSPGRRDIAELVSSFDTDQFLVDWFVSPASPAALPVSSSRSRWRTHGVVDFFKGNPDLLGCKYDGRVVAQELVIFKVTSGLISTCH
jgi:hypothetical protein